MGIGVLKFVVVVGVSIHFMNVPSKHRNTYNITINNQFEYFFQQLLQKSFLEICTYP